MTFLEWFKEVSTHPEVEDILNHPSTVTVFLKVPEDLKSASSSPLPDLVDLVPQNVALEVNPSARSYDPARKFQFKIKKIV